MTEKLKVMNRLLKTMHGSKERLRKGMEGMGLSITNPAGLIYLYHSNASTQKNMAEFLGVSEPSIASLLRRMERQGLVRRSVHPDDARANVIELTAAGKEAAEKCAEMFNAHVEQMFSGFTPQETDTLLGFIDRMAKNVAPED